ncbi:MAG: AarF/UbiB family protein, partial [Acidobacteriota bacterium]
RRSLAPIEQPLDAEVTVADLRLALQELGPLFSDFGRFLALRADLLRSQDCLELAEIPDVGQPLSLAEVDRLVAGELGQPTNEVFAVFEQTPFMVRWLEQSHRAILPGGERVVVKLAHPGRRQAVESELEALTVLRGLFLGTDFAVSDHFDDVRADYCQAVSARLDLRTEAAALKMLGRDARRSDLWAAPQLFGDLSTSNVLTRQWLPGSTLDELADRSMMHAVDASDLARRLSLTWLQMALLGQLFPIEAEVIEMPNGRLAVTGGVFGALPEASRANLWTYVRATVEHVPDRAAASLLREVVKVRDDAIEGELRTRIRQAVPFRDGGWSAAGESLAEYSLLHWRLLRGAGFRARLHLDQFYMGMFGVARSARRFAPQDDHLAAASRDLDWLAGWNQLRQMASPRAMGQNAESYLSSLVELPQKLDRLLDLSTAGSQRPAASGRRKRSEHKNASVAVFSLCLMMVALGLVSGSWTTLWTELGLSAVWADRILAVIFLALGLTLLRVVRRVR